MKIDDIITLWEKDGPVDAVNISNESANTPKLHNKYFKICSAVRKKLYPEFI